MSRKDDGPQGLKDMLSFRRPAPVEHRCELCSDRAIGFFDDQKLCADHMEEASDRVYGSIDE